MIVAGFVLAAIGGTLVRWLTAVRFGRAEGTLLVNIAGSFVLGVLAGAGEASSTIVGVAGMGTLTTFSTFVIALINLSKVSPIRASTYGIVSLVGGVGAAWFGLILA